VQPATILVQGDGKIVLAVAAVFFGRESAFPQLLLLRYLPDGSPDRAFGDRDTGFAFANVPASNPGPAAAALQSDGKILVAGGGAVARFNADGSLDRRFGTEGIAPGLVGGGLSLRPDGKIVVAGTRFTPDRDGEGGVQDLVITRLLADGRTDRGFARNGSTAVRVGVADEAIGLLAQSNGGFVIALNRRRNVPDQFRTEFAGSSLVQFKADGTRDTAFDGRRPAPGFEVATLVALREGTAVNRNGTPDATFGTRGRVIAGFGGGVSARLHELTVLGDGRIVALGSANRAHGTDDTNSDFALARFTVDGRLDGSFGSGGKVMIDFGAGGNAGTAHDDARALLVLPDGKLLVTGGTTGGASGGPGDPLRLAVARLHSSGRPDSSFGRSGKAVILAPRPISHPTFSAFQWAGAAVTRLRDGRVVVLSSFDDRVLLTALKPEGTPDAAFGVGGHTAAGAVDVPGIGQSLLQTSDGRLLAVSRYNLNGTPDATFGFEGRVVTDLRVGFGPRAAVIGRDGSVLLAGTEDGEFTVARYQIVPRTQ
jgi:uncharacterized delta-60 repeat protein